LENASGIAFQDSEALLPQVPVRLQSLSVVCCVAFALPVLLELMTATKKGVGRSSETCCSESGIALHESVDRAMG